MLNREWRPTRRNNLEDRIGRKIFIFLIKEVMKSAKSVLWNLAPMDPFKYFALVACLVLVSGQRAGSIANLGRTGFVLIHVMQAVLLA